MFLSSLPLAAAAASAVPLELHVLVKPDAFWSSATGPVVFGVDELAAQ